MSYGNKIQREFKVLSCIKKQNIDDENDTSALWRTNYLEEFEPHKKKNDRDRTYIQKTIDLPFKLEPGRSIVDFEEDWEEYETYNGECLAKTFFSFVRVSERENSFSDISNRGKELDLKQKLFEASEEAKEAALETDYIPKTSNFNFDCSGLEYDYMTINAHLNNYDASTTRHKRYMKKYLSGELGLEEVRRGKDWALYESKEFGMKAHLSNYPLNRKELSYQPSIRLEFTGHHWIRENADMVVRKIINKLTEKFGSLFTFSRVDIRRDIYGVSGPFDYFPDIRDKERHHMSFRSQPKFQGYTNGASYDLTGFSLYTSRYQIVSYDRVLALKEKLKQGTITLEYYDHYMKIYNGRETQRLEVRLLQKDSCATFYKMFMHKSYNKERTLSYTMANFGRNHVIRDVGDQSRESRYSENQVFSELFHLSEVKDFKEFRVNLEEKAGIKFDKMVFDKKRKSPEQVQRMLAKTFCMHHSKIVTESVINMLKPIGVLRELSQKMDEYKNIADDKAKMFKKTLDFFNLSEKDLLEANLALNREVSIGMSYG